MKYEIGTKIRIVEMYCESRYNGREGVITHIDSFGQLHGTWGGLAVIPERDIIEILERHGA